MRCGVPRFARWAAARECKAPVVRLVRLARLERDVDDVISGVPLVSARCMLSVGCCAGRPAMFALYMYIFFFFVRGLGVLQVEC